MAPKSRKKSKKATHNSKLHSLKAFRFNLIRTHVAPGTFYRSNWSFPWLDCIFDTEDFVYGFYTCSEKANANDRCFNLSLARLCKATRIWENLKTDIPFLDDHSECYLLWDGKTVLLFGDLVIYCIDLKTLDCREIDLDGLLINDDDVFAKFIRSAVDSVNHCIYVQIRFRRRKIALFRLHWDTMEWQQLEVQSPERMKSASFMAIWEDQLYMGASGRSYDWQIGVVNRVIRISLTTLEWSCHIPRAHVSGGRHYRPLRRSETKWCQVGPVVYGFGLQRGDEYGDENSSKLDFWSLHLPTVAWKRHQLPCKLKIPLKFVQTFQTCASEENIWVVPQMLKGPSPNVYQIPIAVPRLHTLAHSAFLYQLSNASMNSEGRATSHSAAANTTQQQPPLTLQRIKDQLHKRGQSTAILRLPQARKTENGHVYRCRLTYSDGTVR